MSRRLLAALAAFCCLAQACSLAPGNEPIALPTIFVPPTAAPASATPAEAAAPTAAPAQPKSPPVTLAQGQAKLWDVAVDDTTVFWTACGTDPYTKDGTVYAMPKDGGPTVLLAQGQACPTEIALDRDNVYWLAGSFEEGYTVWRVAKGGGPASGISDEAAVVGAGRDVRSLAVDETGAYWSDCQVSTDDCAVLRLSPGETEPVALASALAYPDGLVLDATAVYWVNGSTTIMRVGKDAEGTAPIVLASTQFYPQALAVDAGYVYWIGLSYVMRVDKAGGGRLVLAFDQTPADIAVDDSHVYWSNYDGGVMRVPLAGGVVEEVASDGAGGKNLALDAGRVFWSNFDLGTLTVVAKGGGPPPAGSPAPGVLLAAAQEGLTGMIADDAGVYWSTCGTEATNYLDGTVAWIPPEGAGLGGAVAVAGNQSCPVVIGADADRIYWYAGRYYDPLAGDLYAVSKAGGEPEVIYAGLTNVSDFALDDTYAYWSTCGTQEQDFSDAAILAVPRAGGEAVALAAACGLLAVDGQNLYWSNADGIFGVSRAGGEPTLLGPGGADLTAGQDALYFTLFESQADSGTVSCADETSTLMRLPKTGGEAVALATLEGASLGVAVGSAGLYWASDCRQGIVRVPPEGGPASGILDEAAAVVEVQGRIGSVAVNSLGLYWANLDYGTVNFIAQ